MNRELKKRKRRFWVLCLAAVLLMYNILPMTAYAAEYKMKNTPVPSFDIPNGPGGPGRPDIYPGDVFCMQYGAYNTPSEIQYFDKNDTYLMTDTLDHDSTEIGGETYYKGTVKDYTEAAAAMPGAAGPAESFIKWEIKDIYASGGYATSVKLRAVMSTTQSNISYVLDGGTAVAPNPSTYWEGTKVALNDAEKTGYDFAGWYMDAGYTTEYDYELSKDWIGDVTLYAKFTVKDYTISYELDGGSNDAANPVSYTYGTGVAGLAAASKEHYTFDGWYRDASFTVPVASISATDTGDVTLYAKFTPESYEITYNLDGGVNAASNPASYTYGTGVTGFADASKTGYTFDGWYRDASFTLPVTSISATDTGDVTLYAKFTANASTPTPTPAPAATVTAAPAASETPAATEAPMVKDDVPKTGDENRGMVLPGILLLSCIGIGFVILGRRKSFMDKREG